MAYMRRLIDDELDVLMPDLAAIALDGPKGVGKTATGLERAGTVLRVDQPETAIMLEGDPYSWIGRRPPILVDEWQRLPWTWDTVRRAVDDGAAPGTFLLAGSATPGNARTHSGAGRIVSLRMRPMSLPERCLVQPAVSLAELLTGSHAPVEGVCDLKLADYVREIESSGFPGIRSLGNRARRVQLESYLTRALSRDLAEERGIQVRRPATLRAWAAAYAHASSSTSTWENIRRDATPGDGDHPTKATAINYRDWLTSLWLLDPVPPWLPIGTGIRNLGRSEKHQLADPALAAQLLRVREVDLLRGGLVAPHAGGLLGALFESLATLTVRVLAQTAEATTSHLRTDRGRHEIDLIVEGHDGRCVGIEVKLTTAPGDADVRHLLWLRETVPERIADLVILTTGEYAYRRRDGVAVVPLGLLGP